MKYTVDMAFEFGDIVFLKVNPERNPGMITSLQVYEGSLSYGVTFKDRHTYHFARELTPDFIPSFESDS
jgi:hypothetical protein